MSARIAGAALQQWIVMTLCFMSCCHGFSTFQLPSNRVSVFLFAVDETNSIEKLPTLPDIPSTSKRLFLVRHGEVINPGGDRPVFYGAQDVPLSPLGELEAQAAGEYLSQFDLQHVVSSPLARAMYGANQVLERQQSYVSIQEGFAISSVESRSDFQKQQNERKDMIQEGFVIRETSSREELSDHLLIKQDFMELDRGAWCGKTKDEIGDENLDAFGACDESVTPEGGESYPALKERVLKARDEVLEVLSAGRAAAIVSHLQVTRCMLSDALNIPVTEMVHLRIATASVTCIDWNEDSSWTVHFQSFKPRAGLPQSKDGAN